MRFLSLLVLFSVPLLTAAEPPPIQQWINEAIAAGGGIVSIPEGEHVLPRGLVIKDAKKLALLGINTETCVLKLVPGSESAKKEPLIEIIGTAETLEIAKLTFIGSETGGDKSPALLRIRDVPEKPVMKDLIVRDCAFADFTTGLEVIAANIVSVERCSLRDGRGSAVLFRQLKAATARGNRMTRMKGAAFELREASGCLIIGNETLGCAHGVVIQPESQPKAEAHQILNNAFFKNSGPAIHPAQIQPQPILKDNDSE